MVHGILGYYINTATMGFVQKVNRVFLILKFEFDDNEVAILFEFSNRQLSIIYASKRVFLMKI